MMVYVPSCGALLGVNIVLFNLLVISRYHVVVSCMALCSLLPRSPVVELLCIILFSVWGSTSSCCSPIVVQSVFIFDLYYHSPKMCVISGTSKHPMSYLSYQSSLLLSATATVSSIRPFWLSSDIASWITLQNYLPFIIIFFSQNLYYYDKEKVTVHWE
jgi:hypothetical protein